MEGGFKFETREKKEVREVFTDETVVIGPDDRERFLEVYPMTCIALAVVDKLKKVAGISHISLNAKQEDVSVMIDELINGLRKNGAEYLKSEKRLFITPDRITLGRIRTAFEKHGILFEDFSEGVPAEYQGVKIDKETGVMSFCSFD